MRFGPKAALGVAALVGALALGTSAHAAYLASLSAPQKCLAAKVKQDGKGAAGYTGCYAKNASKLIPGVDPLCIGKISGKSTTAYGKLDAKGGCLTTGDATTADNAVQAYAAQVDTDAGHNGKCDGAKQKLVGKYVAAIAGCYSKAAGKLGTVDALCTSKAQGKLTTGIAKVEAKPPCSNTNNLQPAADAFINARACALDPSNSDPACVPPPVCNVNGVNDPGEKCDPSAPSSGWAVCGPDFTCTPSCNCACPSKVRFSGDATDPASILDTGWTGISHRAPIISNGDVTVNVSCSATSRPCGTCNITGLAPNTGTNSLDSQRCSNDSSIHCTVGNDAPCIGGGGTCVYYFGAPLPLAAGGVTTCVYNTFNGPVTGTANVETGAASTSAHLNSRVFLGFTIDGPCARCVGDTTINDGVQGGTCDNGTRAGLACDANGLAPGRPDFGRTSLDCPIAGAGVAVLPIDLSNSTGTVTKTLSASSPKCRATGFTTENCLCDTCNNLAQTPCTSNADCVAAGATVCGGKRCINGGNAGAACSANSECPGGSCNVPGTGTAPSGCQDNTATATLDCTDDGNGEGTCTEGPVDNNCTAASGHPQRGCLTDADCGGASGSCGSANRKCFLTGGLGAETGSNTLTATGMADTPMADASSPTLGAVFCVGPTGAAAVNNVAGLPGPGRVTIKGNASGHP